MVYGQALTLIALCEALHRNLHPKKEPTKAR